MIKIGNQKLKFCYVNNMKIEKWKYELEEYAKNNNLTWNL